MLDALIHQGKSWDEFMRKKASTIRRNLAETSEAAHMEKKEQSEPLKVRARKRLVNKPIGDKWTK